MKLLFIACPPSAELQQALDHHGLHSESVPFLGQAAQKAELITWKISSPKDLATLKQLRAVQKDAWIAVVVPDNWLRDTNLYSALLAAEDKDDVWLETQWESGFWLGLQRAVQSRASRHREQKLQSELESIKKEQEQLVASSTALVEKLEGDVGIAAQVHRKMYPRFSPDVPGVEVYSKYLPASGSGGDYFDIFEFGDKRRFGLLLADGSSHKSAAALLSVLLKVRLDDLRGRFSDSASFVKHLNDAVLGEQPKSTGTLKLTYAVFDRASLQLEITSAGGIAPRLWREGEVETLAAQANPMLTDADYAWTSTSHQLKPGDTLLLYSDGLEKGLPKVRGGVDGFLRSVGDPGTDALELRNRLLAEVDTFRSAEALPDDLTFILLSVDARALFLRPTATLKRV
jgi:sigma-B regulation protein RsbU (phosphoserine phosphatase)